jgi:hypothetical protein
MDTFQLALLTLSVVVGGTPHLVFFAVFATILPGSSLKQKTYGKRIAGSKGMVTFGQV